MHSLQFTAEPSSTDTVERDSTVGDVPGLWSPASGTDRAPVMFDVIIAVRGYRDPHLAGLWDQHRVIGDGRDSRDEYGREGRVDNDRVASRRHLAW